MHAWLKKGRNEYQQQRAMEASAFSEGFRMMSTRELFYGQNESTFVLKNVKGITPRPELIVSSLPFYPDVDDNAGKGSGDKAGDDKKKQDPDVVLYVPMCCRDCEERVKIPLSEMEGVKSVECNWYKKRVIVSGKALSPLSVLLKCQTVFKKAAIFKDD
ncbi:hypothetical protein R1sor_008248 [Riccia sorocarpa]|uniref:HMA domain-containing protein n=1 Tax=Riccia sorocarpa TaxID=122646 RepID=A0ABD3HVQ0_9MARC